jgi:hypothetical protein
MMGKVWYGFICHVLGLIAAVLLQEPNTTVWPLTIVVGAVMIGLAYCTKNEVF